MEPSNVLFIFSDEHDPRYLGANGCDFIRTPNLDQLAAGGTSFDRAYTPCPICVPARASVMTGRYAHETGYWDNCIAYDGRVRSWAHRLQGAGMRVESVGKLHFQNATVPAGFDKQYHPMHITDGVGPIWAAVRDPLPESRGHSPLFDKIGEGLSNYNRYDQATADLAVSWLRERHRHPDEKPWVLNVGLVAPHMPLIVPQRYLDLYPIDTIKLPKLMPQDGYLRHPWIDRKAKFWDHDATLGTDDQRRLAIACYFGLITYLDDQIGRLLRELDATGLAANTLVIYASDHGDNLGARGLWNKDNFYRESVNVPLILRGPGIEAGRRCATNVNLVDLYPTILAATGVPQDQEDKTLPGRSLLDIAREADDPDRVAFSEYHAIGSPSAAFMLARGRYKYHHYVGQAAELFDIEADPDELHDLASSRDHGQVVAEFEARLRSMLSPEAVDRQAKDDQNAFVERNRTSAELALGNVGATPPPEHFDTLQTT